MASASFRKTYQFVKRSVVGYFAPVIALRRLFKRKTLNFLHQMRVVYRYAFWKG
jgi:hypothetical protein